MIGKHHIGGSWREGAGEIFRSHDPAYGHELWIGRAADAQDMDMAVQAARRAFPIWSRLTLDERMSIILRYRAVVEKHADAFAEIIARETGKIRWDAKGEVQAVIGKITISLDAYHQRTGFAEKETNGVKAVLRHRPHGVAAVFGPYNFPAHLPNGHIVPALIAGNTIVFKPSDMTPLVAETMLTYWQEAGLPEGVLNLTQGGRDTGIALAAHAGLDALYFTGSAEVGALLHKQFGGRPEFMLALEMGGNNALIVHEAEDENAAAMIAIQSAFASSGQRCTCARRLIVPEGRAGDAFLAQLIGIAEQIAIGPYDADPQPYMGPLISEKEADKVMSAHDALIGAGGTPLLRMRRDASNVACLTPGIIDVSTIPNRPDREVFGPLLQVIRVADMDAAMMEANNTRYGLSAGIITDNPALYDRFIRDIRAGVIAWNRPTTGASSALPFGGVGISGNHRPSAFYAADYCAYPVAAQEAAVLDAGKLPPGLPQ